VPCGIVRAPSEVLADPHLAARGLLQQVAGQTVLRQPLVVDRHGPGPIRGVPALGEHTDDVLQPPRY
jgi:crotonobetainyl-CoA:carnitine CoA-transferase CaiB-like acyl-CoA transferase